MKNVLRRLKKYRGFNSFDPPYLVKLIKSNAKYIKNVEWDGDPNDTDTVYDLVYIEAKNTELARTKCLLIGYMAGADEVCFEHKNIVRIWFD